MKRKQQSRNANGRHEKQCSVCAHSQRAEIEREFVRWGKPARIAKTFSVGRDALYRHANAMGLMEKRQRNVRAALERLIEHCEDVKVNAQAVVAAIGAYSRINARGEWVERLQTTNMNEILDRMTSKELEEYVTKGALPDWFVGAITLERQEGGDEQ